MIWRLGMHVAIGHTDDTANERDGQVMNVKIYNSELQLAFLPLGITPNAKEPYHYQTAEIEMLCTRQVQTIVHANCVATPKHILIYAPEQCMCACGQVYQRYRARADPYRSHTTPQE